MRRSGEHKSASSPEASSRSVRDNVGASTSRAAAAANFRSTTQQEKSPRYFAAKSTGGGRNRNRKQPIPIKKKNNISREIIRLQAFKGFLIPKLPFSRLVREIILNCTRGESFRITLEALTSLQEIAEIYMTQRFADAYLLTLHRNRVTLMTKDFVLLDYFSPVRR